MLKMGRADLAEKCGYDAMLYLTFQKAMILLWIVCCFFGLSILLPINITSKPVDGFPATTIGNVADPSRYWAHIFIVFLFSFLIYGLVFKFRSFLINSRTWQGTTNVKSVVRRIIFLTNTFQMF